MTQPAAIIGCSFFMTNLIIGTILISLLHAIIPNHWLPVVAIGRKENWTLRETLTVTAAAGLAHVLSTILIGLLIGVLGQQLTHSVEHFIHLIGPAILILIGLFFIWQHYRHHHFHLDVSPKLSRTRSKRNIITILVVAMFFSPCLEIEAYFLLAGGMGWYAIGMIALLYLVITMTGMIAWVSFAYRRILRYDWHTLEHNAGIITGLVLVASGLFMLFFH